jgi:hypothetical protein
MTLLRENGGCKVGWAFYDNEAEAAARAAAEDIARERKFALGYDFGYQWPGAMKRIDEHPDFGDRTVWVVVTT